MSPEEHAKHAVDSTKEYHLTNRPWEHLITAIVDTIRDAVIEEREACARLFEIHARECEETASSYRRAGGNGADYGNESDFSRRAAAAIRARTA